MAWTSPITWVANAILTAAQLNQQLRDNMLQTAPAVSTTDGWHIVTSGTNSVAEREILDDVVETGQSTTSATFTDLATLGPTVTVTTGSLAMVWINARIDNTGTNPTHASFAISGDTTSAAIDGRSIVNGTTTSIRAGVSTRVSLTPGSNTFTMRYRVDGGTGTFSNRRIQVMAL